MEIKIDKEELRKRFPELIYSESMNEINGRIHIECKCRDEYINDSFEIKIETKSEIGDSKRTVEEIENSQEYKKIKGNKVKKTYVKVATDFNPKVAE